MDAGVLIGAAATVALGGIFPWINFYLVTMACGMLRVPFALFAIAGLVGTISRYGLLAWFAASLAGG